jgi:hypothetical protein
MDEPLLNRLAELRARGPRALIDFLNIDLELAQAFLAAARGSARDTRHPQEALSRARAAIQAIRRFDSHVEDETVRGKINAAANELYTMPTKVERADSSLAI